MRVSKEPEMRKQEIIDTAMKVFSEKGYEAATMKDIAAEMKVASGLCYHYFRNKEMLYETAVSQYAKDCSRIFTEIFKRKDLSLEECMEWLGEVWNASQQDGTYAYEGFFHKEGNEVFHRQLDIRIIHEVHPFVVSYLEEVKKRGEIGIKDTEAAARFILYGQMGIINDQSRSMEKRFQLLKEMITKVLV